MAASGKNYTIENCHWGDCTESDDSSCPSQDWCPFNWYRSSGDINAGTESWLSNLQTTIKFQDYAEPLSQPGCWAYPDSEPPPPPPPPVMHVCSRVSHRPLFEVSLHLSFSSSSPSFPLFPPSLALTRARSLSLSS